MICCIDFTSPNSDRFLQAYILVKVVLEVFHGGGLAGRIGQTGLYELTEYNVLDLVEAHAVKHAVKNQIRTVYRDVRYA